MALYSPAYVSTYYSNINSSNIFKDSKDNFKIFTHHLLSNIVNSTTPVNYRSYIHVENLNLFNVNYSCIFDFLNIKTHGSIEILRNSIEAILPINPLSGINCFEFIYILCISNEDIPSFTLTTNTIDLESLFITNHTRLNPILKSIIFINHPLSNTMAAMQKNLCNFNVELPIEHYYNQHFKKFQLYEIIGVGQPNYGIDLDSTAGNGLLDCEFTRYATSAVVPSSYIFSLPGTNYGSYQVNDSNTIAAGNAIITNWYYTINCQLYGKILS